MNDQGQPRNEDEGMRTAQAWLLGFVAGAAVLGAMGIAYVIGFNRGEDEAPSGPAAAAKQTAKPAETEEPAAAGAGAELFAANCGSCHTLAAADTSGTTGPNLDDLAPQQQLVADAIANGGAGSGAMPAGLLQGQEAEEVAAFVGSSAGQ